MQTVLRTSLLALALAAGGAAQAQQPLTEIKVSYQPALYWALPFFVATEKGWWAEVGLKPVFSHLPGRRAADRRGGVEVLGRGRHRHVPAVLGHVRFGIKTIGVTNDESAGNALLVRKDVADKISKDAAEHEGPDHRAHRQLDR